ncbi:Asparagine synthetase [glutamine-hydrolyzing] 1 [Fundidesulfovibrio magnetotacticus]|uniref:asparagine synthase (glutamine-hydrolyzing) n=1 Tax=Fundidesulfovibrio magnetotacticus TaxID=2730080 RepID=A0A6V8LYR9_9BACT|nr:asparagine synthase (glutamine-hydrolyzing) [Fundidesulfovibrio magnetotacticus]GFK95731.1 Asparagine synthetase [glutamine-hydrolyzing] 1 [Fundidesulfovibrio magnetotacticus]
MCGICGFAGPGTPEQLAAMNARLAHRGPDGHGVHHHPDQGVHLAHRRLAIVDLSDGAQPMLSAAGDLAVTFNGEIYNHLELRRELEAKGHRFRTHHSDTETILHGWREWGPGLQERMSGMWAFVLHDARKRLLFASRDRFGKKPLYYHLRPGFFAFASELSALAAHPGVPTSPSLPALRKYFAHGFIPAPNSLLEGVHKLPGGYCLTVDLDDFSSRLQRWWAFTVEPDEDLARRPEAELAEALREALDRAVSRRLMSDVPLGVFLSGGVDSTSVTALAARRVQDLHTFSVGFEEASFDESLHSRNAASRYGTRHLQHTLSLSQALSLLPDLASRLDEPLGDSSILPTYLLCRETRPHVTVALGGDGADELFAGYETFKALRAAERFHALCPRPVHRALTAMAARLPVSHGYMTLGFKALRFFTGIEHPMRLWNPVWMGPAGPDLLAELFQAPADPEEVYSEAIAAWDETGPKDFTDKTLEFYTRFYLQDAILAKVDRASMLNSLEVRAPYLDPEVADLARRIPHRLKFRHGRGKHILRKALEPLVPRWVLARRKQGFAAPLGKWFHEGRLTLEGCSFPAGVSPEAAMALEREHREGRADRRLALWCLWALGHWRNEGPA